MEKKSEEKIVIYRESFVQSVASDIVSILFLAGSFWVNVNYIQSKMFAVVIVLMFILKLIVWGSAKKNVFTDKDKAIEYINN